MSMDQGALPAKRPVSILAGPYGHPLHPALIAVPIGAWVAALVFDIGSHLVDDGHPLVVGARWLMALGVVGAVVAAAVGLLDLLAIPTGTAVFRTALLHMSLNLIVTVAYLLNFLLRPADAATVPPGWLALSAASIVLLGAGGYLGGKLSFRYGVRVADERTQAEGYRPAAPVSGEHVPPSA
jgi:uncharacterized membrane protein